MTPYTCFFRTTAVSLSLALAASTAWADAIVIPIADQFDIIADGAPATLDILANDIDYDPAAPPPTRVSAPPACGSVDILENARAQIIIPPDCPDAITFEYCVDTEIGCLDAVVTLNVVSRPERLAESQAVDSAGELTGAVEAPEPMNAVEPAAPVIAADAAPTAEVVEPAALVVETVEPALAVDIVEDTTPAVEVAESTTPVDAVVETAPAVDIVEPVTPVDAVVETAPAMDTTEPTTPVDMVVEVTPTVESTETATPVDVAAEAAPAVDIVEPVAPVDVVVEATPAVETTETAAPVDAVVEIAPVVDIAEPVAPVDVAEYVAPTVDAAELPAPVVPAEPIVVDPALRAQIAAALTEDDLVGCDVSATVVARPGGFNRLEAHSSCRAGEPILISFDGLRYTARLDADGHGAVELFSLTPQAEAVIFTADGAQTTVDVIAVGLRGRDRVIIAWESFWDARLDLIIPGQPMETAGFAAVLEGAAGGQSKVVFDVSGDAPAALTVVLRDSICGGERVTYRLLRSVDGEVRQDLRRIAVAADCPDAAQVRLAAR